MTDGNRDDDDADVPEWVENAAAGGADVDAILAALDESGPRTYVSDRTADDILAEVPGRGGEGSGRTATGPGIDDVFESLEADPKGEAGPSRVVSDRPLEDVWSDRAESGVDGEDGGADGNDAVDTTGDDTGPGRRRVDADRQSSESGPPRESGDGTDPETGSGEATDPKTGSFDSLVGRSPRKVVVEGSVDDVLTATEDCPGDDPTGQEPAERGSDPPTGDPDADGESRGPRADTEHGGPESGTEAAPEPPEAEAEAEVDTDDVESTSAEPTAPDAVDWTETGAIHPDTDGADPGSVESEGDPEVADLIDHVDADAESPTGGDAQGADGGSDVDSLIREAETGAVDGRTGTGTGESRTGVRTDDHRSESDRTEPSQGDGNGEGDGRDTGDSARASAPRIVRDSAAGSGDSLENESGDEDRDEEDGNAGDGANVGGIIGRIRSLFDRDERP